MIACFQYNDQVLQFQVMALKPGNAVTIIECDMNVEFDAPDGYVEPQAKPKVNEMVGSLRSSFISCSFPARGPGDRSHGARFGPVRRLGRAAGREDDEAAHDLDLVAGRPRVDHPAAARH